VGIRHKTRPLPRSKVPPRSPSRTAAALHVSPSTAGQASASLADLLDLISFASASPSQYLAIEVLRRPLESTLHATVGMMNHPTPWSSVTHRHLKRRESELCAKMIRHRPTDHAPRK
jgi:hypothetical protein